MIVSDAIGEEVTTPLTLVQHERRLGPITKDSRAESRCGGPQLCQCDRERLDVVGHGLRGLDHGEVSGSGDDLGL